MTSHTITAASAAAASARADDADIRILRRVRPLSSWPKVPAHADFTRVCVIDTETTGFDPRRDRIIDIALAMLAVDEQGRILAVEGWGQGLNNPGMPIPPEITRLTGISDDDVAEQSLKIDSLERFIGAADWCLAHNSRFDAGFVEALLPGIAGKQWACSMADCDWLGAGFDGRVLGYLLAQAGLFNEGSHRAMADVVSLVNLLAHSFEDGTTVLGRVLEQAAKPSWRIEATGAPYDYRTDLKRRGYRWDPDRTAWWTEASDEQREAEEPWLAELFAPFKRPPTVTRLTARERYRG